MSFENLILLILVELESYYANRIVYVLVPEITSEPEVKLCIVLALRPGSLCYSSI